MLKKTMSDNIVRCTFGPYIFKADKIATGVRLNEVFSPQSRIEMFAALGEF